MHGLLARRWRFVVRTLRKHAGCSRFVWSGEEGFIHDNAMVQRLLKDATFDSLGRGTVLYFPSIGTEEFEEEDDES